MSIYVSICEHMLTYVNICNSHMLTFVDICWHMLTNVNKFQSKVFHCRLKTLNKLFLGGNFDWIKYLMQ